MEVYTIPIKLLKVENRFLKSFACKAIERPKENQIKFSFGCIFEHLGKSLAFTSPLCSRFFIDVFIEYGVATPLAVFAKLPKLIFNFLFFASRNTSVDCDGDVFLFEHNFFVITWLKPCRENVRLFDSFIIFVFLVKHKEKVKR